MRTNTAVAPFVAVSRKEDIEARLLLPVPWALQPQKLRLTAAVRCLPAQVHSRSRWDDSKTHGAEIKPDLSVPTAVGYTHAHARSHTRGSSTVRGCHKGKRFERCTEAA